MPQVDLSEKCASAWPAGGVVLIKNGREQRAGGLKRKQVALQSSQFYRITTGLLPSIDVASGHGRSTASFGLM